MANNITEQQYRTSLQNIQSRYIRLELLNYNFQTVDELSGVCTSGSLTIDSLSDMRRTGSVELVVQDSSFEIGAGKKIWLDKYVKVWVGTRSLITGNIEYINCGIYLIDEPNYRFNPSNNNLSLSLLDLMSKLTGIRNGYIEKAPVVLKAGENIREAFIETLKMAGFTKFVIENPPAPAKIPNDLKFGIGSTYYNILSELRDIYPNYEMYFDTDGTFYYKPIPTGKGEPILIDDNAWNNIVLSEETTTDFQDVKNIIEVFGRIHNPDHFSNYQNTSVATNNITLTIPAVSSYTNDMIYGFEMQKSPNISKPNLKINSLTNYPILDDNEKPINIKEEDNPIFCVQFITKYSLTVGGVKVIKANGLTEFLNLVNAKYKKEYISVDQITEGTVAAEGNYWRWLGHLQAYGYAEDLNAKSPFYSKGSVGKIYLPLYDGMYSNCITDELAQQRADLELYLHTNLHNRITLNCVPSYWIDVNILVEYTLKRNNIKKQYIVKNVGLGLAPTDSMSVTMIEFYPESPETIKN